MKHIGVRYALQPGDGTYYSAFWFERGLVGAHSGDLGSYGPCAPIGRVPYGEQHNPLLSRLVEFLAKCNKGQDVADSWKREMPEYLDFFERATGYKRGSPDLFPEEPRTVVSNAPTLGGYYRGRGGLYLVVFLPLADDTPHSLSSISVIGDNKYDIMHSYQNAHPIIQRTMDHNALADIVRETGYRDAVKLLKQ